jgi:hypothetical protein
MSRTHQTAQIVYTVSAGGARAPPGGKEPALTSTSPRPPGPLYHITCRAWAKKIVLEGRLRTGESSIRPDGSGPKVVWFTTDPAPTQPWACVERQRRSDAQKNTIRITVALPEGDAQWWPLWARARGISEIWYEAMAESGGNPDDWWVVTRPVPSREFVRIEDVDGPTDDPITLWTPEAGPPSLTPGTPLFEILGTVPDYEKVPAPVLFTGRQLRLLGLYPTDNR